MANKEVNKDWQLSIPMQILLTPPSLDDIIRLLKAWRFWVLGALIGAALGAAAYYMAPPPYRARATVNVDFNFEQAFPQNTDRQDFYYLEREARKLVELAWADDVLNQLNHPISELRGGMLTLSQPAEAGWHFYAEAETPNQAEELAAAWAQAFVLKAQAEIKTGTINNFVALEATQTTNLPTQRSIPLANYLVTGASAFLLFAVFYILFIKTK